MTSFHGNINMRGVSSLYLEAMADLETTKEAVMLSNRFKLFNQITGGFRPHEFSILCGSTGSGKTTFCANISADLVRNQVPHFVASVETGSLDFTKRILCCFANEDINTGDPVPVEKLKAYHGLYGHHFEKDSLILSLYEDRFSVESLMEDILHARKSFGCKLAIIDNLNFFLEVTSANQQVVEMDRVVHELIIFCKKIDCHIVMVMHPKKTENGRVMSEFDVKGSSTSVQEAHNVFLFNRPQSSSVGYRGVTENDRQLTIAKMRRRGKYVGSHLFFGGNSVCYEERTILK